MSRLTEFAPARRARAAGAVALAFAVLCAGALGHSEAAGRPAADRPQAAERLPAGEPAAKASPAGPPAVGREGPDFSLEAVGGGRHALAARRGKGATVLVFFRGTW
jgi:hypothetical protein